MSGGLGVSPQASGMFPREQIPRSDPRQPRGAPYNSMFQPPSSQGYQFSGANRFAQLRPQQGGQMQVPPYRQPALTPISVLLKQFATPAPNLGVATGYYGQGGYGPGGGAGPGVDGTPGVGIGAGNTASDGSNAAAIGAADSGSAIGNAAEGESGTGPGTGAGGGGGGSK